MLQAFLTAAPNYLRPMFSHVISCSQCQNTKVLQPLIQIGMAKQPDWVALRVGKAIEANLDVAYWNSLNPVFDPGDSAALPSDAENAGRKLSQLEIEDQLAALSLAVHYLQYAERSNIGQMDPKITQALKSQAARVLGGWGNLDTETRLDAFKYLWISESIPHWTPWMDYIFSPMSGLDSETRQEMLKVISGNVEPLRNDATWFGSVWNQSSHNEHRLLLRIFLKKASWTQHFLRALHSGEFYLTAQAYDDTSLTLEMELSLRRLPDPELRSLALEAIERRRDRLGLTQVKSNSISQRFNAIAKRVRDTAKGQQLFQQNCQLCHRFHGQGAEVGPDLNALNDRSGLVLLTAILNPNEAIEQSYMAHELMLKDGSEWTVLITNETSSDLSVSLANGEIRKFAKSEIESLRTSTRSLMPDGWGDAMSDQELADLMGYLQSSEN